jgi:hypothetical protein
VHNSISTIVIAVAQVDRMKTTWLVPLDVFGVEVDECQEPPEMGSMGRNTRTPIRTYS